ncbi:MAG: hypothetical protein NT067_06310 [Candidatus Diapherotrites archaeon]|nr:hypothetical protein [Candidatus Diapherotrites archaeon]
MEAKARAFRKSSAEQAPKESLAGHEKSGSKTLWIAVAVFLVLAAAAVIYFGGVLKPQGGTEEEAIAFADTTAFGKLILLYDGLFAGGKDCGFEKFVSLLEAQAGTSMTSDEKSAFQPYFESAKQCMPSLAKKAEKAEDGTFTVSYSFEVPASCTDTELADMVKNDMLGISDSSVKVDLKAKKAEQPGLPAGASFTSWEAGLEDLETSIKEAKESAGTDSETMMDCSLVGSLAMYSYTLASMDSIDTGTEPAETGTAEPETTATPAE